MKQINKNIFWNAVGNTAYNGLQWLITVIVTRRSGFGEAGILAIAMSVSLAFRTVSYFGIRNFQVTDNDNKYSVSDYLGLRIITSMAAFILCLMAAILSNYSKNIFQAVLLYMIFRISEGFSDLFQGIMQKNERLDIAGICLFIKSPVTTAAFIIGFYFTDSLNSGLLFMSVSAIIMSFVFEFPIAKRCAGNALKISFYFCGKLALEALPMFVYTLEAALILNMPKYFLSLTMDKAFVGIYSSVFSLALILQGAFQYIYVPFVTRFSVLENDKDYVEIKKLVVKIIYTFAAATLLFSILSCAFGNVVLILIFGQSEHYRAIILPAVLSVCAYSASAFISTFAIIKRKFFILIAAHVCGIISFVFFALLIKGQGINSVSYGLIFASIITGCIILFYICIKEHKL